METKLVWTCAEEGHAEESWGESQRQMICCGITVSMRYTAYVALQKTGNMSWVYPTWPHDRSGNGWMELYIFIFVSPYKEVKVTVA